MHTVCLLVEGFAFFCIRMSAFVVLFPVLSTGLTDDAFDTPGS